MNKLNIAIDGPAGAGKSTIARIISERLGIMYLDTGAMYRAVAFKAIKSQISFKNVQKVIEMLNTTNLQIEYNDSNQRVFIDGMDVTDVIRTKEVTKGASDIAVIPEVRIKLVEIQRDIAHRNDLVMDGRDIGTFVLPKATKKFFLTASLEERSMRRYLELKNKGDNPDLNIIKDDIIARDENDSNRDFAPLKMAEDAILINTTDKSIKEVADEIFVCISQSL